MNIRRVDPRTTHWEDHQPVYRVYFWAADVASDEYELRGVSDVSEVRAWAEEQCVGRTYAIYAVVDHPATGTGIVRLCGVDPTRES